MLSNFRNLRTNVITLKAIEKKFLHNCRVNLKAAKTAAKKSTEKSTTNNIKNIEKDGGDILKKVSKNLSKEKRKKENLEDGVNDKTSTKELMQILKESLATSRKLAEAKFMENSMMSYVDACATAGFVDGAQCVTIAYLKGDKMLFGGRWRKLPAHNIRPVNEMLRIISMKGTLEHLDNLLAELNQNNNVVPNCDTFALWLVCLVKNNVLAEGIRLRHFLSSLKKHNVTLESVYSDSMMAYENLPNLRKAITHIDPDAWRRIQQIDEARESDLENFLYSSNNPLTRDLTLQLPKSEKWAFMSEEQLMSQIDEQFDNESKMSLDISHLIENPHKNYSAESKVKLDEFWKDWTKSLREQFKKQMVFHRESFMELSPLHLQIYPYIAALSADDLTDITALHIQKFTAGYQQYESTISTLAYSLGDDIFLRYLQVSLPLETREKYKQIYKEYCKQLYRGESNYIPRVAWLKLLRKNRMEFFGSSFHKPEWPEGLKMAVGQLCVENILNCLAYSHEENGIKQTFPAFFKMVQLTSARKKNVSILPHPLLVKLCNNVSPQVIIPSNMLPMVCPPVPWTSRSKGSFLASRAELLRLLVSAKAQYQQIDDSPPNQLYPVLDSVNQLANVPWKINKPVFSLIKKIWMEGGNDALGIAEVPAAESVVDGKITETSKKEYAEMNSLYCDASYKIALAEHFIDRVIWLPENLDFRGRVYPIPPHMTHIAADAYRALMVFAQGKQLGNRGLWWLKLHVINMSGLKKRASIEERLAYFDEIQDDIFDSADNPFEGKRWWTLSEDPWQTLAACIEVTNALRSDNPLEYVSHLPVHQDGSCNGLQHYAALGRDKEGATSVNLANSYIPEDVYTAVANKAEVRRLKDAEKGVLIASQLEGCVVRKVVKQTVMTTVYGVTPYGASIQIYKRLQELDHLPVSAQKPGSKYLMRIIFASIEDMFTSTKIIQNWLGECSNFVTKLGKNVSWVSPMGLPISQPYSEYALTFCPQRYFRMLNNDLWLKPNSRKQRNGFPPNFIHSLDSSHMMLTSLYCQQNSVQFASVHDCFWTHAATVDNMGKICREQFVHLHSQPILENLLMHLRQNSIPHAPIEDLPPVFQRVPQKGEFDLQEVLQSTFFFS